MLAVASVLALATAATGLTYPEPTSPFKGPTGPQVRPGFFFRAPRNEQLSRPTVDANSNIYVSLSRGLVQSIDGTSGKNIWAYHSTDFALLGESQIAYGSVFVGTSKGVIALNQATGAEQWTFTDDLETPIPTFVFIDPAFASTKTIFITGRSVRNETGSVTAINGATGQVLWNANTHNNPDLAVAGGLIVGGFPGRRALGSAVEIAGFNALTGVRAYNKTLAAANGKPYYVFLFETDGTNVFIGYGQDTEHTIASVVGKTGAITYTTSVTATFPFATIGTKNIYLTSFEGTTAFAQDTGKQVWTSQVGISSRGFPVFALPASGEGAYIVTGHPGDEKLVSLSIATGAINWQFRDPAYIGEFSWPVFDASGNAFIESFSQQHGSTVYGISGATNGTQLWRFSEEAPRQRTTFDTSVTIGKGFAYLANNEAILGVTNQ